MIGLALLLLLFVGVCLAAAWGLERMMRRTADPIAEAAP